MLAPGAIAPQLAVIIPLPDHRGPAWECMRSWTSGQTLSRENYEVIVVADGREPQLEAQVRALLTPHDRLLVVPNVSLEACGNLGAQASQAPWLLFTEAHVQATADCLEQLLTAIASERFDVASLASSGIQTTRFAAQEQLLYDEALLERLASGWNCCTVRGFAIGRQLFERAGGFPEDYGHFGELLLGASLAQLRARLGYASRARVSHFNDGDLTHFWETLIAFGRDEIRFRADHPDSPLLEQLGPCRLWDERQAYDRATAWCQLGQFLRSGFRSLTHGEPRATGRALEQAYRAARHLLFGLTWSQGKTLLATGWALLRLWLNPSDDAQYLQAFRDYWSSLIQLGRLRQVSAELSRATSPAKESRPDTSSGVHSVLRRAA